MRQAFSIVVSIAAILMIGNLLILAHELSHYIAARSVGLVAERFTIGFGPNLFRVTDHRGTLWSLSALPLGGFVSFAGESDRSRHHGYAALPPPARLAIIAAGPAANILVAIGLFAGILAAKGETTLLPIVLDIGILQLQRPRGPEKSVDPHKGNPCAGIPGAALPSRRFEHPGHD